MRLDELERELRAERPQINPEFSRKLDEWAAAGFPRGGELGSKSRTRGVRVRRGAVGRRGFKPQRWLAPAGGLAALIALVVGVSSLESGDDQGGPASGDAAGIEATPPARAVPDSGSAAAEAPGATARSVGGDKTLSLDADSGRRPHGKIAQDVDLALATAPDDFRDAADGVLDVVDDHGGFVLKSSVSGGDPDVDGAAPGRANFDIRVPAGELQAAIAGLSDLGHVVSRTDGTKDITTRFTEAKRRIAAYSESRDRLLRKLEDATTETERQAIRAQLRIVEAELDAAQNDLSSAQQRVRLVPVRVTVSADESVTGAGGDWGIGDALDDAGRVLTVAAGVLLISAAALLPLAILIALAWGVADRLRHRQRERALDTA
jgi:hypothetical protein